MRSSYIAGIVIASTVLQAQTTFLKQEQAWPSVVFPTNF